MGTESFEMSLVLVFLTILTFSAPSATSSASDHSYNVGDNVPLFVNKIGPLNNPRYHLPPRFQFVYFLLLWNFVFFRMYILFWVLLDIVFQDNISIFTNCNYKDGVTSPLSTVF